MLVGLSDASRSPLEPGSSPVPGALTHSIAAAASPRLHGVGSILTAHSSQWLGADFFLVVHVREARDLQPCDPLVRVSLQRGGGAKSRPLLEAETRVLLRNRNPMFEQSLTFPLDHVGEDMELVLRVRDNDIRHFESFMGQVTLSMWEVLNAVTELGQEICYSMPLYDDSGLGRLRPGTLSFGVAVHAKSTYKELLASRAALQDPGQIQALLQSYALHLKLQGFRGLAGPAAAPGAGLVVHVGLAGYEASRPLRCAVVGGEADPPDMELAVPLGRALAGVAGLKGKAAARAQFGDVRIELHNSKGRLLAKTQVPLWSVPFQHPQHPQQQQQQQQRQQDPDPQPQQQQQQQQQQHHQQQPNRPLADPPGPQGAAAAAGAGTRDGQGAGSSSNPSASGSSWGNGPSTTAGSGSSAGSSAAPAGAAGSAMSSPFAQAAGAAAVASGAAAPAPAATAPATAPAAAAGTGAAATADDASTRSSSGSSTAASGSEGAGRSSGSSSSGRTSFSAGSAGADRAVGGGAGSRSGADTPAAAAGEGAADVAAVAVARDQSYDRHSVDSGLAPPALPTIREREAPKEALAASAAAAPAAASAAATANTAATAASRASASPAAESAGVSPAHYPAPAPDAPSPAQQQQQQPQQPPQQQHQQEQEQEHAAVAPPWAGRRYCRRMERVDKGALSAAPTVLLSMQLCPAAAALAQQRQPQEEAEPPASLLGEELSAAVTRSAASASLASTSGGGWREVLQSDGPASGASSGGGSAAQSHLMSLAGGLTRPLVRGITTLIGAVAGTTGDGNDSGGAGGAGSASSITAAAAATTGGVAGASAPPPDARSASSSTTAATAAAAAAATAGIPTLPSDSAPPHLQHTQQQHHQHHHPPQGSKRHMRAELSPAAAAAAADAAALLASPNADPLDFNGCVDVPEPGLAALLPPLAPLEHVLADFVVRTGPHELANALFGHQSPVTAKVADDMGVSGAVVVVGWGPDKEGRAPMARHMTYLTPTPLVGTTPVEHVQRMVTKTDAGFVVENRITPNPLGVGRVVTITVQVVGRHAGPGKTRLTASLKADWYGSRALYLLKGRVLAACPKESRGYYNKLRAELDKVFGAEDVGPRTEGAAATAATRARVAAAAAAAAAAGATTPPVRSGDRLLPSLPSSRSGVAPGFAETADADDAALAAAAALAASGGPAAAAIASLRTIASRRRGAPLAAPEDASLSVVQPRPSSAGWLLLTLAAVMLVVVAGVLGLLLWAALGALRSATEELADSRRQLERAAGLLEAAAVAAQAAAVAAGAPGANAALVCAAGE
ncbi:hypothetical protein HYH02_005183 [Chlamydomonas schloesseri]|uniref:C2 domain-containing protein n=1 Tax=Chlamydomonas schloesseri TaxID=2026947 RepID=A0A835WLK2_9CHLO|nr:hypothetical protein HYH02_005183 [Chlamydomonas schloesseri]|eukprot:KAG2449651.1 hypothetical protein HYH02_005183 [Chlamydomonas schloesseri]